MEEQRTVRLRMDGRKEWLDDFADSVVKVKDDEGPVDGEVGELEEHGSGEGVLTG